MAVEVARLGKWMVQSPRTNPECGSNRDGKNAKEIHMWSL